MNTETAGQTPPPINEKPRKPYRLFGILTLIIAACVFGFVLIIYASMIRGAVNESDYVRIIEGGVPTQIRAVAFEMERWATVISEDPKVRHLVTKATEVMASSEAEPHGQSVDQIRKKLLHRISMRWGRLSQGPRPKDVQILIGEEFISFLQVNQPSLFGYSRKREDTLLFESYETRMPASGFET